MTRSLVAAVALIASFGLVGLADAQSGNTPTRPFTPPPSGPLMGIEPMADSDATLTYQNGPGTVTIDLGGKMINCNVPGAPSGGSTGTVPSPYHPCR